MTARKVRIGKIVGCHGLRGEVKVRAASGQADWVDALKQVFVRKGGEASDKQLRIAKARENGPQVLMTFEGYDSRTLVEPLVGAELFADAEDLPAPKEGEYWVDDLIGLAVVDAQTGRKRGVVKDLLSSGGSDFLEIQLEESNETVVIPFIDHFFPTVNLAEKTVSIDLLSDFLSLSAQPITADRLPQ